MINFFKKKKKNDINSIIIPDFGWQKSSQMGNKILWINPDKGMMMILSFFDIEPDLPSLKRMDLVRKLYRDQVVQQNGGLIEVESFELKKYTTVRTIYKIPQDTSGMGYSGALTIPFENCSYVINIAAREEGMTGMRDAVVAGQLLRDGIIEIDENGFSNWFLDPYDSDFKEGTPMNKSEDPIYDKDFEEHPLTRVRKLMAEIEKTIEFKPELEKLKKFEK